MQDVFAFVLMYCILTHLFLITCMAFSFRLVSGIYEDINARLLNTVKIGNTHIYVSVSTCIFLNIIVQNQSDFISTCIFYLFLLWMGKSIQRA